MAALSDGEIVEKQIVEAGESGSEFTASCRVI